MPMPQRAKRPSAIRIRCIMESFLGEAVQTGLMSSRSSKRTPKPEPQL